MDQINSYGKIKEKTVLPLPNEITVQMSPFGNERWEIDDFEKIRRREIHRNYIFKQSKSPRSCQQQHPAEECEDKSQQHQIPNKIEKPLITQPTIQECHHSDVGQNYFEFKRQEIIKPKTLKDLNFDPPKPPNLYPLLKYPATRGKSETFPKRTKEFNWYELPCRTQNELPRKLDFSAFKDVLPERPQVQHYGMHVPFWQF